MSYRCQVIGKAEANRAAALSEIEAELTSMGWESWDASSHVWASQSETGSELKCYLELNVGTANQIYAIPWYYWNASTHAGTARGDSIAIGITTSETGCYLWVIGNKNFVVLMCKVGSTYTRCGFGFPNKRQLTVNTTLSQAETSGTPKQIHVASTTGFVAGHAYQIVGVAQEGRDQVTVNSVDSGTTLTLASLPRNYGSGALIGQTPVMFGATTLNNRFSSPFHGYASGTATAGSAPLMQVVTSFFAAGTKDARAGCDLLEPVKIGDTYLNSSTWSSFAWYIDDVLLIGTRLATVEDLMAVGKQTSGTATGGTSTTLANTGASWTVDAYIGKCVLITGGTGLGQVRKITDNDGTTVTVDRAWDTQVDNASVYMIADEAYLGVGIAAGTYFYARVGC